MPDPYNYSIQMQSPLQAFSDAFQVTNAVRQQQAQQQQQEVKRKALASVMTDRSPENLSRIALMFPELADQIKSSQSILNDAQKQTDISWQTQVLSAIRNGRMDLAKSMAADRATALRNSGKEQDAKAIDDIVQAVGDNPEIADSILSMNLSVLAPDAYKNTFGQKADLTSFQKDLAAAGIDPASEEGRAKSREYVELKTDPIVEMETPSGGKFVGRQAEYYRRYGGNAPAPTVKAMPRPGERRGGYEYIGGDPANKANWRKVGDGGSNASGGFR